MPPKTTTSTSDLSRIIADLQRQRDRHTAAIAEIDAAFATFGVKPGKKRGPGRPKGTGTKKPGRKKRGRFGKTADQFVLDLLLSISSRPGTRCVTTISWRSRSSNRSSRVWW